MLTRPGHSGSFHRERSSVPSPPPLDFSAGNPIPLGAEFSADFKSAADLLKEDPTSNAHTMEEIEHPHAHALPRSESGLSYAADQPRARSEDNQDWLDQGDPFYSGGRLSVDRTPWTSEPESRHPQHLIGSIEHTEFSDIRPPTWEQLQEDDMTQKFMADMYKFMYITCRSTIKASESYDTFADDIERLEKLAQQARDEATEAHREVQRLSGGMAAMQKTILSLSDEIKLSARRAHESSPPQKNLPPRPATTRPANGTHPNTVPCSVPDNNTGRSGDPAEFSDSQIRLADAEMLDVDSYPVVPVPESGWSTVAKKGVVKNRKGTVQMKNAAPAQPTPPARPRIIDDSQLWILRFNGNPPTHRMTPNQMHARVNSIFRGDWPFDVVTANWSQGGNGNCIMLRFTAQTSEQAIDIHHAKILDSLAHGMVGATLTRNVQWAKVVVMNVPCRKPRPSFLDEDGGENPDELMHENEEIEAFWSPSDLDEQMKINPLYRKLLVTQKPDWTSSPDAMEGRTHANISFSFEDPHSEFTSELFSRPMYLFNERCPMRVWKERIHVPQCERCWKLGPSHENCNQKCRYCTKTGHLADEHQAHCPRCEKEGWAANGKICIHFSCANCNATHAADDPNCRTRSEFINIQRNRNNARYQKPTGGAGTAHNRR